MRTPIRRIHSGSCASATNGHAVAAPPTNEMKSSRLIAPQTQNKAPYRLNLAP